MSRPVRLAVVVVSTIVGVALFVWQVRSVGIDAIRAGAGAVGWGAIGIVVLSCLRFGCRSVAWVTLMGGGVTWSSALAAFISGDAIGNLTPLRLLASEPAKALLLGRGVDSSHALAALVVENACYGISIALVILLGAAAMLSAFDVAESIRWAGWTAIGSMAVVITALAGIMWFKPAIASAGRVRAFEDATYGLVHGHNGRLVIVVAAEAAFHVFSFAETYLTLWLLTGVSSPIAAFVLDTVGRVINVVFMMVPLRLGVAEAGTGLIASAIGLTRATGVSLALVAKGRVLFWAGVGLILILLRQKAQDKSQK